MEQVEVTDRWRLSIRAVDCSDIAILGALLTEIDTYRASTHLKFYTDNISRSVINITESIPALL